MTDFDDQSTPPRAKMRPLRALTDSERDVFRSKLPSAVPLATDEHEDTSPVDLFERAPRAASQDLVARLTDDPAKLIPFVGELAEWVVTRLRERSSSERDALKELRDLLSKPPNGATKQLQEDVRGLARAFGEVVERLEEVERLGEKTDDRVKPIEETIKGVKGSGWKAVAAIIPVLLGSAAAVIATMQSKAERDGVMAERVLTLQRDIAELKAAAREPASRPPRRDYDYDLSPRPLALPPKKEP